MPPTDGSDELKLGIYKHYKHHRRDPKYYLVLGVARHAHTEEKQVVYVPLYVAGGPRMAVRPLDEFLGTVTVDGVLLPRFEFVGSEVPDYSV